MTDMIAVEQELLKSIILNPRSKPRERLEALKRLAEAGQGSACAVCSGRTSPDEVEFFWSHAVGDALTSILNRDPGALSEFPEAASALLEPIERLERLEEEAGVGEAKRWRAPAVRAQRARQTLARETELQQQERRRGRGLDQPHE